MLKPQHSVVRVADDNYIARRFLPPPLVYPEVEYIMQVEIGEGWRNHRPLRSPLLCLVPPSLLHHARLQPFLDQADDSPVSYSVLDEFDHPRMFPATVHVGLRTVQFTFMSTHFILNSPVELDGHALWHCDLRHLWVAC